MTGISLFVPVLNEEAILEKNARVLLDYLAGTGRPHELVIISNGSTDGTEEIGRRMSDSVPNFVFDHMDERGPGGALKRGIDLFRHDHVIAMDMDLSVASDFISAADRALDTHALVLGSKQAGHQNRSLIRRTGSALFIGTSILLLGLPYRDYSIGAKGYRLDFLAAHRHLIDRETGYVLPLAYAAQSEKKGVVEIPIECVDLRASRFNLPYEAVYRFGHLARFWWSR